MICVACTDRFSSKPFTPESKIRVHCLQKNKHHFYHYFHAKCVDKALNSFVVGSSNPIDCSACTEKSFVIALDCVHEEEAKVTLVTVSRRPIYDSAYMQYVRFLQVRNGQIDPNRSYDYPKDPAEK